MQPERYTVITGDCVANLVKAVNALIETECGWEPHGSMSSIPLGFNQFLFMQPLVKFDYD